MLFTTFTLQPQQQPEAHYIHIIYILIITLFSVQIENGKQVKL